LALLGTGWAVAQPSLLHLRVRSAIIRGQPSMSEGESKGTAYLGQACQVLQRSKDGDWARVRLEGPPAVKPGQERGEAAPPEGWLHATVLVEKPLPPEACANSPWVTNGAPGLPASDHLRLAEFHAKRRRLEWIPLEAPERFYPGAYDVEEFLRAGKLGLHRSDWPSLEGGVVK
jgi:hypothetical protein